MSLLFLAGACGKAGTPDGQPYREELKADGSNINGTYSAILYPVNINLHAPKSGMATFNRSGDELTAKVKLNVGAQGAHYRQAIYWGNHCPGMEADLNKDGYLDMPEMEVALGDIIVPLDGDLDTQAGGTGQYPSGSNVRGSYFYKRTASFSRFFEDLKAPDPNSRDRIRKLEDQQGFTFLGKVVLVQGATAEFRIPETVSSYYGLSRLNSLPIACGVIFKSDDSIPDEDETVIVAGEEPNDSPRVPGPDVNTEPSEPQPTPTPAPTPTPRPAPEDSDDDDDDDDTDSVRDWWCRLTGCRS